MHALPVDSSAGSPVACLEDKHDRRVQCSTAPRRSSHGIALAYNLPFRHDRRDIVTDGLDLFRIPN